MKKILIILIGVVALGVAIFFLSQKTENSNEDTNENESTLGDPIDAVAAFYNDYLAAQQNASIDPWTTGVMDTPLLASEVRADIETRKDDAIDPVLCQSVLPQNIRSRTLFMQDGKAQIQVLGRLLEGEKSSEQAVVSLEGRDGAWVITSIQCMQGESAPEREFTFEREGFLLKSVPPPLDSNNWHLVFEQNGTRGHTVPLFFDGNSMCTMLDGQEQVCDMNIVDEATKATVKGQMTEAGVNVQFLELHAE